MPKYEVKAPDGKTYDVNAPDGATEQDAIAYVQKNFYGQPEELKPAGPKLSRTERVLTGIADQIHGGAQLLTKMLPESVVQAGNSVNNWISDKTGLVARLPDGGVDQQVREREQQYQDQRGDTGFDGYRLIGNALPSLLTPAISASSLPARVAVGSLTGAANNALAPVTSGDFSEQKGKQLAAGAIGGAVFPVLGAGVSRVISPKASLNPDVAKLRGEGITPTVGQVLGGAAQRTEEKLSSLPIVGDAITKAKMRSVESLNRVAANRALSPVGEKLPDGVMGREAVEFVGDTLGKKYDELLPKLTVKADQQFASDIGSLSKMVRNGAIDPKYASAFDRFMKDNVLSKFRGQNALTGQTVKDIESDLGQKIARLSQSQDPDARLMADALKEVQSNLRGLVSRSNPNAAKELSAINSGYANYKRIERAAAGLGADDGVFSPAQLQNAVKALDKSKDKRAFAQGKALMQDLSESAKAVLGPKVPNSGTADRLAAMAALLDPRAAAMALTAPVFYSQPGQKALAGLLASRPQGAEAVANSLRQAAPGLGLLGGQVGLQFGLE